MDDDRYRRPKGVPIKSRPRPNTGPREGELPVLYKEDPYSRLANVWPEPVPTPSWDDALWRIYSPVANSVSNLVPYADYAISAFKMGKEVYDWYKGYGNYRSSNPSTHISVHTNNYTPDRRSYKHKSRRTKTR